MKKKHIKITIRGELSEGRRCIDTAVWVVRFCLDRNTPNTREAIHFPRWKTWTCWRRDRFVEWGVFEDLKSTSFREKMNSRDTRETKWQHLKYYKSFINSKQLEIRALSNLPASTMRNITSYQLREWTGTFCFQKSPSISLVRKPTITINIIAWDSSPIRLWWTCDAFTLTFSTPLVCVIAAS